MAIVSNGVSRRAFVASAAVASAFAVAGNAAVAKESETDSAQAEKNKDSSVAAEADQEVEYDLVIVGGGFSGCCAAMEAADTGKKIAVVERQDHLGGNADFTEGVFGLNSKMMNDAGISVEMDIPELVHNELSFTNWRTDGRVWYDVFGHSGEDIDWLAEHGIVFDHVDDYLGVSAVPCFHWWEGESGRSMGENALKSLQAVDNVDIILETEATSLETKDGAVAGVTVESSDGSVTKLVTPAVIMATGGFVDNKDLVKKLTDTRVTQTLGRGYDGKGHEMMVEAGAKETLASSVNNLSVGSEDEHYFLAIDNITLAACYQSLLTVNEAGERFVDENLFNEKFTVVWVNALRQQKAAYTFFGQNIINEFEKGSGAFNTYGPGKAGSLLTDLTAQLEEQASKGNDVVYRGDTLEELAKAAGMDPEVLSAQIDRYNKYCETGVDEEFYCPAENLRPTGDGPFYLVRMGFSPYTTVGGVKVDRENRVLNDDDEPVPGLFSCGVEGCSLFKETYNYGVSGGQGAYNIFSGRNAAKTAMGLAW